MKIGLVLSGGGGKGAYELGVWKALKDLSIDKYIEVISGTSIGAFNAALFAQNDLDKATELWDKVTMDSLVPLSKFNLVKKGIALSVGAKNINFVKKYMVNSLENGVVARDGLKSIVESYINIEKIKSLGKICYATCTEIPDFKVKYFKLNDYKIEDAKEIIMASASLPLIYESAHIQGKKYLDGGMVDNVPIQPVYGEGCDIIIVVLLSKDMKVDRSLYPNTKIIEIYPKELEENVINGVLNLDIEAKKNRIVHGYNDTKNLLEPIMDLGVRVIKKEVDSRKKEEYSAMEKLTLFLKKIKDKNNGDDNAANY
ncbi:MAG: patatin-like phospholipase family protein [Clostridium perfringens]|nr:patatin-like phospholipase family protein [Clostridium perfringens]